MERILAKPADKTGQIRQVTNSGIEYFKIKSPDMLGSAQWVVHRNKRAVRIEMLHRSWLDNYHARKISILPGDSLKCKYEEKIVYDQNGTEIERRLSVVEVLCVIRPPSQQPLFEKAKAPKNGAP